MIGVPDGVSDYVAVRGDGACGREDGVCVSLVIESGLYACLVRLDMCSKMGVVVADVFRYRICIFSLRCIDVADGLVSFEGIQRSLSVPALPWLTLSLEIAQPYPRIDSAITILHYSHARSPTSAHVRFVPPEAVYLSRFLSSPSRPPYFAQSPKAPRSSPDNTATNITHRVDMPRSDVLNPCPRIPIDASNMPSRSHSRV